MSICLATKGVICPAPLIIPQRTPYSPILDFDVEFSMKRPLGLLVEDLDTLDKPKVFRVENLTTAISAPIGFEVEGDGELSTPAGFGVSDESFVKTPTGFTLEDV